MTVQTTTEEPSRGLLLSGRRVHLRFAQSTAWSVVAGLLGASFVAGAYYLVLQQHWYVHLGGFNHGSSAKLWWDNGMGFIHSRSWHLYRHGIRDLGQPAVATMAVRTLLAQAKYWGVRVSTFRLAATPLLILVLTLGLTIGGIWVLDFSGPWAWAHAATALGHHGYRLNLGLLARLSLGNLALGFVIGQVLHKTWAPVGATLQGFVLDRAVDRAKTSGRIPLWETLPLMAPVIRERFALMYREDETIAKRRAANHRARAIAIVLIILVTIIGVIAKFYVARGGHIPYLAP